VSALRKASYDIPPKEVLPPGAAIDLPFGR
jgi:hypothetical protein